MRVGIRRVDFMSLRIVRVIAARSQPPAKELLSPRRRSICDLSKKVALMKLQLALACSLALACTGAAMAQTTQQPQSAPQNRPDARYHHPSGQDSKPSTTTVKPTKPAPRTAHPEDPHGETTGEAAKQTYQAGKKSDDTAGCSTPTDASRAQPKPSDQKARQSRHGKQTVCTTTGERRP